MLKIILWIYSPLFRYLYIRWFKVIHRGFFGKKMNESNVSNKVVSNMLWFWKQRSHSWGSFFFLSFCNRMPKCSPNPALCYSCCSTLCSSPQISAMGGSSVLNKSNRNSCQVNVLGPQYSLCTSVECTTESVVTCEADIQLVML